MPARPRKGARFGGSAAHQKAMMANLVASLIAAEAITTTEAKAKAMRPVAEKMITKAKKGGVHNHRNVVKFLRDREMASKLFDEIGPRYEDRPGGYIRIIKLDPRSGDNADGASSWSDLVRLQPVQNVDRSVPFGGALRRFRRMPSDDVRAVALA